MENIRPVYVYDMDSDTVQNVPLLEYKCYMREQERVRIQIETFGSWGPEAFWLDSPTESLSGNDSTCRLFIENVTKISMEEDFVTLIQNQAQVFSR